jgi:N-acetylglutamate synthase-like GNAT family acetyltransferase
MEIKKATKEDIEEIKALSKKNDFGLQGSNEMYVLKKDGKILGFTGLIYHRWNNTLQISDIFIIPKERKKGLGLKLVLNLIEICKKIDYRCLIAEAPSLSNAPKLYEKAGFRKCGYNDRYYSNNGKEKAIWYSYDLK